jgi:hypothetical protein
LQVIRQQFVRDFRRACTVQNANTVRIHVEEFHVMDLNDGAPRILRPQIRKLHLRRKTRRQEEKDYYGKTHHGENYPYLPVEVIFGKRNDWPILAFGMRTGDITVISALPFAPAGPRADFLWATS